MESEQTFRLLVILDEGDTERALITPYIIRELEITEIDHQTRVNISDSTDLEKYDALLIDARKHNEPGKVIDHWEKLDRELLLMVSKNYRSEIDENEAGQKLTLLFTDTPRYVLMQQLRQMRAMQLLRREKKNIEARYKKSIRQASHEIMETVNTIQGYSHRLIDQAGGVVPQHELVRLIRESEYLVEVSNTMFRGILPMNESVDKNMRTVFISELVEDVYESFKIRGKVQQVNWEVIIDSYFDQPIILDATKVRQILHNLIKNMIKHSKADHLVLKITSTTELDRQWEEIAENGGVTERPPMLYIELSDNGYELSGSLMRSINHGKLIEGYVDDHIQEHDHGLLLMQRFLNAMDGKMEVEPNTACGTMYKVRIPFDYTTHLNGEQVMSCAENRKRNNTQSWEGYYDTSLPEVVKQINKLETDIRDRVKSAIILLDIHELRKINISYRSSDNRVLELLKLAARQQAYGWLLSLQEYFLDDSNSEQDRPIPLARNNGNIPAE